MSLVLVGWFVASIACDVTGQLCFKRASNSPGDAGEALWWWSVLANRWVLFGAIIYSIEILVWLRILSLVPLAVAFPIASLNFIAITLAGWFWLGEHVSPRRWAGTALVTTGVVLVALGA